MRKFVSIIAAAALTGSIAITGAVSASANDGMGGYSILNDQQVSAAQEITSEIPAATESFTEIEQILRHPLRLPQKHPFRHLLQPMPRLRR